jgi:hypothetical protein
MAYILRKRKDLNRRLLASWSILQTMLPAIGLLVGLLLAVS